MKQAFILGRNPELSKAEILAFAESHDLEPEEVLFEENYFVVDLRESINIQELGGSIHAGEISFEGTEEELVKYLEKEDLYDSDKFKYGVFGNVEPDILKEKFKAEKRKAVLKHGRQRMSSQEGEKFEIPKADAYFLIANKEDNFYFSILDQEYDYEGVKERDMEKPERREELAISPRLSKILINLSGAKQNDLLLDPFCGIGGILIEALIKKIKVYGTDKDSQATKGALQNLTWLKQNFKITNPYIVERRDANRVPDKRFDAIATETPLGEVVRHKQNRKEAEKIIHKFENLIIPILDHLKTVKKPEARIAITFPKVRDVRVDYERVQEETGLKLVLEPIEESRKGQFIGRDIVVFE